MADKDYTLGFCRYYKGKTSAINDQDIMMCIRSEKKWVECMNSEDDSDLSNMVDEYIALKDLSTFNMDDGVPITLKAVIANRYFTYKERTDILGFKNFYNKYYGKGDA